MENNFELQQCSENDVMEFDNETYRVRKIINAMSRVFKEVLGKQLFESLKNNSINIYPGYHEGSKSIVYSNYFSDGVDCEILKVGSDSWRKGKFKINVSIEFIPDEPETEPSELDSVRQEISN